MPKPKHDPDIFGALVADHHRHRGLLEQLEATNGASTERKRLFEELTCEIKGHAAAEEPSLWSTVLRKPEIMQDGRHAVAEHHDRDERLDDLAPSDMASGVWLTKFRKIKAEYLHHIKQKKEVLFADVAQHLDEADQTYMASVFKRRKQAEKAKAKITPETMED